MAFNLFPYSNFHKINLDWVIKTIQEAKEALDQAAQTVTGYESRLAAVESGLDSLSVSVSAYYRRLQAVQADVESNTQNISSLSTTVQSHTQQISAQGQQISGLGTTVQSHTQQISAQGQQISGLGTTVQSHTQQISGLGTTVQSHTQQITQLGEDVAGKVDVRDGKAANLRLVTVTGPGGGTIDENTGIKPTVVAGLETALAIHPITNGVLDSQHYAKVYVGSPEQAAHATTKDYVDNANTQTLAALANKVDNLNGKAARLTLAAYQESGPSDQYGVRIDASPGTRTSLELHPINNGIVDTSVFAEVAVGDPTGATHAANKRYVDLLIYNRFRKLIINVFPYANTTDQNRVHYAEAYDITPTAQAEGFNSMREQLAALVGVGPEAAESIRPSTVSIEIHAYNGEPLQTPAFSNLLHVMPAIYDLTGFPSSQAGSESGLQISVRGGAALPGSSSSPGIPNFTGDMYPTVCFTITNENTIEFYNWYEI